MPRYNEGPGVLGYLFRFLFMMVLLAGLGFVAFAYLGDLSRPANPQMVPVTLGGD